MSVDVGDPRTQQRGYPPSLRDEDPTTALLRQAAVARDAQERQRLLDEVVVRNLGLARSIAMRYRNRGIAFEDLDQVARLGLVKAARGFDAGRQGGSDAGRQGGSAAGRQGGSDAGRHSDFLAYAVPTIRGEVRKHFRDHGWTVRPPRRIQELQARIMSAATDLTQTLGRSPRPSELSAELGVPVSEVEEALAADGCFTPSSLDRPVGGEDGATIGELLPSYVDEHAAVDARVVLAPAVRSLGERDRTILHLRFFYGWTQEEIAREIGVTQMHVSRLLTRIIAQLRACVTDPAVTE